jgi:hypothetical protein
MEPTKSSETSTSANQSQRPRTVMSKHVVKSQLQLLHSHIIMADMEAYTLSTRNVAQRDAYKRVGTSVTWRQEFVEPWLGRWTLSGISRCSECTAVTKVWTLLAYAVLWYLKERVSVRSTGHRSHCWYLAPTTTFPLVAFTTTTHARARAHTHTHRAQITSKTAEQGSQEFGWKFQSSGTWHRADWHSNLSGITFQKAVNPLVFLPYWNKVQSKSAVHQLWDAFGKFRKATTNFVVSVPPSVSPHGPNRLLPDRFRWNLISEDFFFESRSSTFTFDSCLTRITDTLHEDGCVFVIIFRWIHLRKKNVSDKICREKQNTHFAFNNVLPKILPFIRQCGKMWWGQRGHTRQYNMTHALCMLDN